jgi:hypothetical protein
MLSRRFQRLEEQLTGQTRGPERDDEMLLGVVPRPPLGPARQGDAAPRRPARVGAGAEQAVLLEHSRQDAVKLLTARTTTTRPNAPRPPPPLSRAQRARRAVRAVASGAVPADVTEPMRAVALRLGYTLEELRLPTVADVTEQGVSQDRLQRRLASLVQRRLRKLDEINRRIADGGATAGAVAAAPSQPGGAPRAEGASSAGGGGSSGGTGAGGGGGGGGSGASHAPTAYLLGVRRKSSLSLEAGRHTSWATGRGGEEVASRRGSVWESESSTTVDEAADDPSRPRNRSTYGSTDDDAQLASRLDTLGAAAAGKARRGEAEARPRTHAELELDRGARDAQRIASQARAAAAEHTRAMAEHDAAWRATLLRARIGLDLSRAVARHDFLRAEDEMAREASAMLAQRTAALKLAQHAAAARARAAAEADAAKAAARERAAEWARARHASVAESNEHEARVGAALQLQRATLARRRRDRAATERARGARDDEARTRAAAALSRAERMAAAAGARREAATAAVQTRVRSDLEAKLFAATLARETQLAELVAERALLELSLAEADTEVSSAAGARRDKLSARSRTKDAASAQRRAIARAQQEAAALAKVAAIEQHAERVDARLAARALALDAERLEREHDNWDERSRHRETAARERRLREQAIGRKIEALEARVLAADTRVAERRAVAESATEAGVLLSISRREILEELHGLSHLHDLDELRAAVDELLITTDGNAEDGAGGRK